MDKSICLTKAIRGVVSLGALSALLFNFSTSTYAGNVAERDLPGVTPRQQGGAYDPVTGQATVETPSAESVHGEAVVANSVSPASQAKEDFSDGAKSVGRGFKNGTKATGRGFKKVGTTVGSGFKTAGSTMGKGFQKAGDGMKWFFTGQWIGNKNKGVEQHDLTAEKPAQVDTYDYDAPNETKRNNKPAYQEDDLELDFDGEGKGDDWAKQDQAVSERQS